MKVLASVAPTLLAAGLLLAGCRAVKPIQETLQRFEFEEPQMGVPFRIVLYTSDTARAETAARAAFDRIAALNAVLSDYEYDSELSRLSRSAGTGEGVRVSAGLWTVLSRAQELARCSDGAFDVTVGPCVSVWRKARRDQTFPAEHHLQAARQATGWRQLVLDPERRTARLEVPRMRLDLGGIAKGFAVDQAFEVLARRGIRRALVSGGGDLVVGEPPPDKVGWRIEVPPVDSPDAPPTLFVLLKDAALATSGDLYQHVEIDGIRYSHIVDPRTGIGLTDRSLVTIIARDGITADGLSTAVSVLGPDRGAVLANDARAAFRILRRPGQRLEAYENRAFRRWLEPRDAP